MNIAVVSGAEGPALTSKPVRPAAAKPAAAGVQAEASHVSPKAPAPDQSRAAVKMPAPPKPDPLAERRDAARRAGTDLFVDEATGQIVAKILNAEHEVIKQIPPEESLEIAARFQDLVGLIFDAQA